MKYFSPNYWFKLWVLSVPLFNDKTQGINAKSIDNKKIKDWVSNNTSLESINEPNIFTNTSNYQPYNLNETNQNINPIYQAELETSTHKHRHEKSRNRHKRQPNINLNFNKIAKQELEVYYDYHSHNNKQLDFGPSIHTYNKNQWFSLDLVDNNPVDYNKIEFLGNVDSDCWGTMVNWGSWVYTNDCYASWGKIHKLKGTNLKWFFKNRDNNFHDIIYNTEDDISSDLSKHQELQKFWDKDGLAKIDINQRFALTFYWKKNRYYMKVFGLQYCNWWASAANFNCHLRLGSGIRLYKDDNDFVNLNRNFQREKELNLYYDDTDKNHDFTYIHDWYYNHTGNKIIKTFNLGKTNPIDYNKIEFLGNDENFKLSRVSWGNVPYYSEKKINDFNNKNLHEIIKNYKFDETNKDKIFDYTTILLQPKTTKWWSNAWLEWSQSLGLTWYWENNSYFLQVISSEYANDGGSLSGGSLFMSIGNGIRLYNDNENIRTKREIFDKNNLEDKPNKRVISNDLKNITKWTNEFTNSINNEQNVPIFNNTNFVKTNITSL